MRMKCLTCLPFALLATSAAAERLATTFLDDYINTPDDSYAWEVAATHPGEAVDTVVIDLNLPTLADTGASGSHRTPEATLARRRGPQADDLRRRAPVHRRRQQQAAGRR